MSAGKYLAAGTVLHDRYKIESVAGEGAFGIIYLAEDMKWEETGKEAGTEPGCHVAVKEFYPAEKVYRNTLTGEVCPNDPADEESYTEETIRFIEKARVQEHYSQVYDIFAENNTGYAAMEYLAGGTLRDYIDRNGKLDPQTSIDMLGQIFYDLTRFHGDGYIHCDISPDNLMFDKEGILHLIDFGSVRTKGDISESRQLREVYAPLELYQDRQDIGPWSDVYSLCAVWYEMVCGKKPEKAPNRAVRDTLRRPSDYVIIDEYLERAMLQGLSVDIQKRYFSVVNLAERLHAGDTSSRNTQREGGQKARQDLLHDRLPEVRKQWGDVWVRITTEVERNNWKQFKANHRKRRLKKVLRVAGCIAVVLLLAGGGVYTYLKCNPEKIVLYKIERDRKRYEDMPDYVLEDVDSPEFEADLAFLEEHAEKSDYGGTESNYYHLSRETSKEWGHASNHTGKFPITLETFIDAVEFYLDTECSRSSAYRVGYYGDAYVYSVGENYQSLIVETSITDTYEYDGHEMNIEYDNIDGRMIHFSVDQLTADEVRELLEKVVPIAGRYEYFDRAAINDILEQAGQSEYDSAMISLNRGSIRVSLINGLYDFSYYA